MTNLQWEAPGPGLWQNDKVHFNVRSSILSEEARIWAFRGAAESGLRYGFLAKQPDFALVNGFIFTHQSSLLSAVPGETREQFESRISGDGEVVERFARAEAALRGKRWRDDLRAWDMHWKPSAMATNYALASISPGALDDEALADYVLATIDNWFLTAMIHHLPNGAHMIPGGMLQVFLREETDVQPIDGLSLLSGAAEVSGPVSPEARAFREGVRSDPAAVRWLESQADGATVLEGLSSWPGEVGRSTRRYLQWAGFLLGMLDITSACALEMPEVLGSSLRGMATGDSPESAPEPPWDLWRERVPTARWDEFVELTNEARSVHRLKDERGAYCNGPARGIARMALLEAGRRLYEKGRLHSPDHLLEASRAELELMLEEKGGPNPDELRDRYEYRLDGVNISVPESLGAVDLMPVNSAWLPEAARVITTATAALGPLGGGGGAAPGAGSSNNELSGAASSNGNYRGRAIVIRGPEDFERVEPGDVMVTATTSSSYNVVFPLLGAVVTDFGGPLSHAAIMSREFGIPCVAGCGTATRDIDDGELVIVDGTTGVVTIGERAAV